MSKLYYDSLQQHPPEIKQKHCFFINLIPSISSMEFFILKLTQNLIRSSQRKISNISNQIECHLCFFYWTFIQFCLFPMSIVLCYKVQKLINQYQNVPTLKNKMLSKYYVYIRYRLQCVFSYCMPVLLRGSLVHWEFLISVFLISQNRLVKNNDKYRGN